MALSFSILFGVSRENADIVRIATHAVRQGYAVLPVYPNTKKPMCTLTPTARQRADKAVATAAKEAGRANWMHARHECGFKHAITDEKEAQRVFKRLYETHPDLNIALEVGRSRMIVVDADNAADVETFTRMWADEVGVPDLARIRPTVSSPGLRKEGDEWTHKDGGHFWFSLPDDVDFSDAPTTNGLKLGEAVVYFKDRVLLVPPSTREEGPYVLHSDVGPAPVWLLEAVRRHIDGHKVRAEWQRSKALEGDDPIDAWAASVTWSQLLEPDDWTPSHKFDSCGCEIWSRPGAWSSWKSATAHEPGCTRWEQDGGFLHLWTDDPPDFLRRFVETTGHRSLSKLQYVAWRDHDGMVGDAMRELELAPTQEKMDPGDLLSPDFIAPDISTTEVSEDPRDDLSELIAEARPEGLRARMYTRSELDRIPPPVWLVKDWITRDSLARLSGAPGSYKTFVALDMACCVATGLPYHGHEVAPGKVLYVAAEGVSGIRKRVKAWEVQHGVTVPDDRFTVLSGAVYAANAGDWAELCAINRDDRYDLIFLDTQARMTAGMDENSNSEMSLFIARMDVLKAESGASVMVVHHSGHGQGRGRGASSMWGGMDVELFLDRDKTAGTSKLGFIKSKDSSEDLEFIFKVKEHVLGVDSDGEDLKSITLYPVDAPGADERGGLDWWIQVLDNLGTAWDAGKPTCAAALRAAGYKIDDKVLAKVIKKRKERGVHKDEPGGSDDADGAEADGVEGAP